MTDNNFRKYWCLVLAVLAPVVFFAGVAIFLLGLGTALGDSSGERVIMINRGDSLEQISSRLYKSGIIRSPMIFQTYALLSLKARLLKPGKYIFMGDVNVAQVLDELVSGGQREVYVTIPEGFSVKDIDKLLTQEKVISGDELITYARDHELEGYLFPDTYRFYLNSNVATVVEKFLNNFKKKINGLLTDDDISRANLIIASLIQKEVANGEDGKIVAGIILKRLKADWPLQLDATICYLKPGKCYPLTPLDFKIDSPYNTYLYKGLPINPIANPGLEAIVAALRPEESPYWYYLSDPKTGKTYFAKTLEEQNANKSKVLP